MSVASHEWQIKIEGHQFITNKADRSLSKFATNLNNLHALKTTSHILYTVIYEQSSNVIYKYILGELNQKSQILKISTSY